MDIMPNSTRWLAEDVIKLIELVQLDEAIYNARHMNYFCRPYVENFWRQIDLKLKKNPGSSLAKWTNLRISFRREYQIYLTEKVQPSWIYFEKMLFLSPFLRKKRPQIEGLEPHIQEALEQISSITRGNYKSFVESIERCGGSTESVTGDERRTPDPEEEIWDENSIKEESIEESTNEHDDELLESYDNDNIEVLSERSSLSIKSGKNHQQQSQQQQQQQNHHNYNQQLSSQQQRHFLKRFHSNNEQHNNNDDDDDDNYGFSHNKRFQFDNEQKRLSPSSSSLLTVRNLQIRINNNNEPKINNNIDGTIGNGGGSNENINKNILDKNFDIQTVPIIHQGRCSRSSTASHGIDYSNNGRNKDDIRDIEQKNISNKLITTDNNCHCKKDPDSMFLMSLLPDIQSLTRKDRGKLKIEIQKVVQNFLYPD